MTRVEFKEIEKLIFSSDLLKGEMGEYTVGENRFCLDIKYSDGSQQKFEKVSLTPKDYSIFESLFSYSNPISSGNIEYVFKNIDCAISNPPPVIQQPMDIAVPNDTIN